MPKEKETNKKINKKPGQEGVLEITRTITTEIYLDDIQGEIDRLNLQKMHFQNEIASIDDRLIELMTYKDALVRKDP